MNMKKRNHLRDRRIQRVRLKVSGTSERPRLSVYRSLRHIYAQVIDDTTGKTLVSYSTMRADVKDELQGKKKTEQAAIIGDKLGKIAIENGVTKVVFDKRGNPYTGRIKALADAARNAGLKF